MASYIFRLGWWAMNTAGVAWVILQVTTRPVALPASSADSRMVFTFLPSGVTEIMPLFVLWPVASAVPPAAESVIRLSEEKVSEKPATGKLSR